MSGSDGNRGYLVQTLIALLESLRSDTWTVVTIEPKHEAEEIDIKWEAEGFRKAVQVKSSITSIGMPDAKRWASQLEKKTAADELVLILVSSGCSSALSRGCTIGQVVVRPPKNLEFDGLFSEAAHRLDSFLFTIGLTAVSPEQSRLLVKGLVTELSCLASNSKPLTRSEFVDLLKEWVRSISPASTRSLHDTVLAEYPRALRSNLGSQLIGRSEEARWLRETEGDKLIVGQPGIGKTFLLRESLPRQSAFFLRSDEPQQIDAALRAISPDTVIVEDAHLHLSAIEFLRRWRVENGIAFNIVADGWPGSRDLITEKLAIKQSKCLELRRVSDQDIVDIVHDCGIQPSNSFLHMVVQQSDGFPGRAMMLVETCLGGTHQDYLDFWNGETLTRWVRTRFTDLVGREAVQVLACFAIGGGTGVSIESVAKTLELSRAKILQIVSDLALGGVVFELSSGRIAVVPRSIRPVLVRDHFFGNASTPLDGFLQDSFAFSECVTVIAEARALGAEMSMTQLWELAKAADNHSTWRAFVNSCDRSATLALSERPDLLVPLATDFLQTIPAIAASKLLHLARGDERPLHSTIGHPLRLLSDWAKSGYPSREAVPRRRVLLDTFMENIDSAYCANLALRLLPILVSPEFQDTEQNPGNRLEFSFKSGCVSIDDLKAISALWSRVLQKLSTVKFDDWRSVLEAVREWLWPHFGGGATVSDEQREVIDSSALGILLPLSELAKERPGVLRNLAELASLHGVELNCSYSCDSFEVLFPPDPSYDGNYEDYASQFSQLATAAMALGEAWCRRSPGEVIKEISECIAESQLMTRPWPDFCSACCDSLSAATDRYLPWVRTILDCNARADLLVPFLRRAIDANEEGWSTTLSECIEHETYRFVGTEFALTNSRCSDAIVDQAITNASKVLETVRRTTMLNTPNDRVISKLLGATESTVVCAALEGIWHRLKTAPKDAPWYDQWRRAVVCHLDDNYCLHGAIVDDPQLAMDWIAYLATTSSDKRHFKHSDILLAVGRLTPSQKSRLIDTIQPNAQHATALIMAVVGESPAIYERLLQNMTLQRFWSVPLRRKPTSVWGIFAEMATLKGIGQQAIINETRRVLAGFGPVPEKYDDEIAAWMTMLDKVDGPVRGIVEGGLQEAQTDLRDWLRWDRERSL